MSCWGEMDGVPVPAGHLEFFEDIADMELSNRARLQMPTVGGYVVAEV